MKHAFALIILTEEDVADKCIMKCFKFKIIYYILLHIILVSVQK